MGHNVLNTWNFSFEKDKENSGIVTISYQITI